MKKLISELIDQSYLKTPRIIRAMKKIDRADFVLPDFKESAYINLPLPIGRKQTISQPLTVAFMLELLQPKEGDKTLDIGSGSGWTTALLAEIVGKKGKVFSMELIPELCNFGMKNINKYFNVELSSRASIARPGIQKKKSEFFLDSGSRAGMTTKKRGKEAIQFLCIDGSRGYSKEAPYDRILVSAAADAMPKELKNQLKIKGRLVIPIKNSIRLVERISKNKFREEEFYGFTFVPLINN